MSALVISLDFELFWGVTESRTIKSYGANIAGVWQALPAMLKLFQQYHIQATWATVGMVMCKNFKHWSAIRPTIMPTYPRYRCNAYAFSALARDYPKLFFAPELVEQILATDGQELASHTYSHFYCGEDGVTVDQFVADLDCTNRIFTDYAVKPTSIVFPRNQIGAPYLETLAKAGFNAYRGNQVHCWYRKGQLPNATYGKMLRLAKFSDAYLPLSGQHISSLPNSIDARKLLNIPASLFLRPASNYRLLNRLHLTRVKSGMLAAAKINGIFHLWWHPHNFGVNLEANLNHLENILMYYQTLNYDYGMSSLSMTNLERSCRPH
jgi:Polysaccharide deacetylase